MANTSTVSSPLPKALTNFTDPSKERIYILHFRQGNLVQSKNFNFIGSLKEATERGKKHCEMMGYRFIYVRPFVVDLDHQEHMKLENNSDEAQL